MHVSIVALHHPYIQPHASPRSARFDILKNHNSIRRAHPRPHASPAITPSPFRIKRIVGLCDSAPRGIYHTRAAERRKLQPRAAIAARRTQQATSIIPQPSTTRPVLFFSRTSRDALSFRWRAFEGKAGRQQRDNVCRMGWRAGIQTTINPKPPSLLLW